VAITRILGCMTFLLLCCLPSISAADTAQEMAGYCEAYRTTVTVSPQVFKLTATPESRVCWGAFSVIQGLGAVWDPGAKHSQLGVCLPEGSTRTELVKVFLRYMDVHPQVGHLHFEQVVVTAIQEAWPCPR
jgi:hypothetical protein